MKKERRQVIQAAVIDVGSHAARMDLFQRPADGKAVLLESLTRDVDLGREVFRRGEVPPGEMALLCTIMADYRRKLDEYGSIPVRAFATSALREAANRELVADRLRDSGGVTLEIFESARECYLAASAMRRAFPAAGIAPDARVLGAHIGAGSLFLVYFERGVLCFGEEIPAGRDRLPPAEAPGDCARAIAAAIAASGAVRRLQPIVGTLPVSLFVSGKGARRFARETGAGEAALDSAVRLPEGCPPEYRGSDADAACAYGAIGLLTGEFVCDGIFVPGFTTRSALLAELPEFGGGAADPECFAADFAGVSRAAAGRFAVDPERAERTARLAAALWKKLRTRVTMPERSLPLLEGAARLRDIGNLIDCRERERHSAYFIGHLQLPGIGDDERRLLAATVLCSGNGDAIPAPVSAALPPEHRPTLFKLAALLRVAAALSESRAALDDPRLNIAGGEFLITPRSAAGGADRSLLARHAELFVRVFGLRPRFAEAEWS